MRILRAARHAWRMTNPWSPMIRDSRGRPTPLYRVDRAIRQAAGAGELPANVFDRIRARLLAQTRAGMGSTPLGLLLGSAAWLGAYIWSFYQRVYFPGLRTTRWVMLGCAVLFLFGAWLHRYRVPRARREAIAAALLEERRCPSCAYDLHAAPADGGGLVVCSECGAAWRLQATAGPPPLIPEGR